MSLLTQQSQENSLSEKQSQTHKRILQACSSNYKIFCILQKRGLEEIWNNPDGLTPQQACNALGTNAAKVFDFHASLTEAIVEIATRDGIQPDIGYPTFSFIRNPDGTVTVLNTPYTQ